MSFVRLLLCNACACDDTLSFETTINYFTEVFSKVWKQFMKRNTSLYLRKRALEDPSFVFLVSSLINTILGPQNVILTNRRNGLSHDGAQAPYL